MSMPKILALIAFRNEEQYLPGLFSHLRDYVDGFIALDDCSTDRSANIARAEPKLIELFEQSTPSDDHFFETQNRETLLLAAHKHGADWVLACDADERFETRFLRDLRPRAENPPAQIMGLHLVAVWENFQQHRVGNAQKFVFFPSTNPRPYQRPGRLHQPWFPPCLARAPRVVLDYYLYHLGSLSRTDRMNRFEKFERLDPQHQHQPSGYNNLIDESNLVLRPITLERAFRYE